MKPLYSFIISLFFLGGIYGQTSLQYNLKKDEVYTVKQVAKQIITQELEGSNHILTNSIDGILEFKVVDEIENEFIIEFTFMDLNMKMTSNLQGELMNVKANEIVEGDIQSLMFNSILKTPINIRLSQSGEIIDVSGGDSLVTKMISATGLEDEFTKNMMRGSLEKEFGSEALSNSYEQMTFFYSDNSVQIGDTWKNEYSGKLSAQNTWTFTEKNEDNIILNCVADVIMKVKEPTVTMNLTGTQSTEVSADLATGFINKMTVVGSSKGSSIMAQIGSQEIPTQIESTITYELITE